MDERSYRKGQWILRSICICTSPNIYTAGRGAVSAFELSNRPPGTARAVLASPWERSD